MKSHGNQLIRELLADPERFNGYELLKEYYAGFPIETLIPLLSSTDLAVRRVSTWIGSELSKHARPLIASIIPLVNDEDPQVRFHALEIVAVCSFGEDAHNYVHVVAALEDRHDYIRTSSMFLVCNAEPGQLEAAAESLGPSGPSNEMHKRGLSQLVPSHLPSGPEIALMIDSPAPLLRKYGAIAAWRHRDVFPDLISRLSSSSDQDIRMFSEGRCNVRSTT